MTKREVFRPLTMVLHGDWGNGKSWFAQTAPAPRLVLDAEGGSDFTMGRKKLWENVNDPPPQPDGTWDTCFVRVRDMQTLETVLQWLQRGKHPFVSVIIDSLSELQKRLVDEIAGTEQMRPQDWGELFRRGESTVRAFRDLKHNPVKPISCIVYITGAVERGEVEVRLHPYVQGQLGKTLPGFADIVGMLKIEWDEGGEPRYKLYVRPQPEFVARDRTHCFRNSPIDVTYDDETGWERTIEDMMRHVTKTLAEREKGDSK